MDVNVEVYNEEKSIAIQVSGEIDAFTAPMLKEQLLAIVMDTEKEVSLDLSSVNYMDSTGLGVIVAFYKKCTAEKADLTLVGLSDRLRRLFDITGLSGLMKINSEGAIGNHERI